MSEEPVFRGDPGPGCGAPAASRRPAGKRALRVVQLLVTIALLVVIGRTISWQRMGTGLEGFRWLWAVPVVTAIAAFFVLGAVNNFVIITSVVKIPFRVVARIFMLSVAAGVYTPAFVGEFGTVAWLLRRRGVRLSQSLAFSSVDKFLTLFVSLAAAVAGLWLYFPEGRRSVLWIVSGAAALLLPASAMALSSRCRALVRGWLDDVLPAALTAYLVGIGVFFHRHPARVAVNLGATVLRTVLGAVSIWAALEGLGIRVGFVDVMMVNFVARMATIVPLAFNGLGLLEGAAMTLFTRIGVAPESTLLAFLMDRAVTLLLIGAFALYQVVQGPEPLAPELSSGAGRTGESK